MKITRDIPEQLIVENNPLLATAMLIAMSVAFIGAGIAIIAMGELLFGALWIGFVIPFFGLFFFLLVRRNQLILDAPTGTATHRRKTLRSYVETVRELAHLDRAEVERSDSGEGGVTYRMVLVFSGGDDPGTHPFTTAYSSGGGARRGANAVNRWLDNLRSGA